MALLVVGATAADAADGAAVYQRACAVCHANLPPKLGDKRDWAQRLQQADDALVAAVIKGKGLMSPRAGNPALTDDEIRAAVAFIRASVM